MSNLSGYTWWTENDCVRTPLRWTMILAPILALAMAALPQANQRNPVSAHTVALVDINHASIDDLMKVPGMTRSWAGRIVRFRPYRAKSDLVDHGVVTVEFYVRIKEYVIAHRDAQ